MLICKQVYRYCILGIIHRCKSFAIFAVTIQQKNLQQQTFSLHRSLSETNPNSRSTATQIGSDTENCEHFTWQIISSIQYIELHSNYMLETKFMFLRDCR